MLNSDILVHIFSFLNSASLRRASSVSKEWNNLITNDKTLNAKRKDCLTDSQKKAIHSHLDPKLTTIFSEWEQIPLWCLTILDRLSRAYRNDLFKPKYINENIWATIEEIYKTLIHPYPQNSSKKILVENQNGSFSIFKLNKTHSMFIDDQHNLILGNGRVVKNGFFVESDDFFEIIEPTGILDLTELEEDDFAPVKKSDVVNYIFNYLHLKIFNFVLENSFDETQQMFKLNFRIANYSLSERDILLIYNYLKKLNTANKIVTTLDLSLNSNNADIFHSLIHPIVKNFKFQNINLSYNKIDDSVSAVEILKTILSNKKIIQLNLTSTSIGDQVSQVIAQKISANDSLQHLELDHNQFTIAGIKNICDSLKNNTNLKSLACNDDNADAILGAIAQNPNSGIEKLQLNFINPKNLSLEKIKYYFSKLSKITVLYLIVCDFTDNQMAEIFNSLMNNNSLSKLSLARNTIENNSAKKIASFLRQNNTLTTLNLDRCKISDENGIEILSALLYNKTLKQLDIEYNEFTPRGLLKICEIICLCFGLVEVKLTCPSDKALSVNQVDSINLLLKLLKDIIQFDNAYDRINQIKKIQSDLSSKFISYSNVNTFLESSLAKLNEYIEAEFILESLALNMDNSNNISAYKP